MGCPLRLVEAPPNLGPDPDIIGYNITFKNADNIANQVVPSTYYAFRTFKALSCQINPSFSFFFPSDFNPALYSRTGPKTHL